MHPKSEVRDQGASYLSGDSYSVFVGDLNLPLPPFILSSHLVLLGLLLFQLFQFLLHHHLFLLLG